MSKSDHVRALVHGLKRVAEDRQHALAIANSASMFLISRCEMIDVQPYLGFIFLRRLCDRNIESWLEEVMERSAKAHDSELTPELREEMLAITKAMEAALLEGLEEKEVSLEEMS